MNDGKTRFEDYQAGYNLGYKNGKLDTIREVLKILKKEWTGLDLSINNCDEYYIREIEKL